MAPALKAKRLKNPGRRSLTAVANKKPKWEKPRKSISAQSELTKIKNVNKRSFDPIKANRGVVLLQSIPHGFYEDEMRKYFGQFGLVTRVRLARCQRSGRSKGFAYIEFKVPEVAEIAAETMDNYIMFKHKLKATYIPPEKQSHNFFRKDVTFTTDANGETTFSSAKLERIQKAADNVNRVLTDEEHAKRMKRDQKLLQKQQKKLGVDLSNILASGNSSSDGTSTTEAKPKESKKKATAAKNGAEKKQLTKQDDNKLVAKKDKKKASNQVSSSGNEPLWHKLLDKTLETDTSDDDFKIDHTFDSVEDSDDLVGLMAKKLSQSADDEESDSEFETDDDLDTDDDDGFKIDDESEDDEKSKDDGESDDGEDLEGSEEGDDSDDSEDDGESDDMEGWEDDADSDDDGGYMEFEDESEVDDEESEDSETEIVPPASKDKKKLVKGAKSNGAADLKAKPNLKRKHKGDSSSPLTSSSQSELDTGAKKMKQNPNKKNPSGVKAIIPVAEPSKASVMNKKKQKPNHPEKLPSTSSSEPESLPPQMKHKKTKLGSSSKEPQQKMNKKKAKQNLSEESTLSSSIADTTSSEPEIPKQKLNNKKKSKLNAAVALKAANVVLSVKNEKAEALPLKSKPEKKKNQPGKDGQKNFNQETTKSEVQKSKKKNQPAKDEQIKFNPKTAAPKPAESVAQKSKKKIQSTMDEQTKFNPKTSALVEPAVQKSKKKTQQANVNPTTTVSTSSKSEAQKPKDKQKTVPNGESVASKPESGTIDKKKKKIKPVKSTLINENGLAKKSSKAKTASNKLPEKSKKSSAWLSVSETDESDKPKAKDVKANLKTIVHKNNSKKKNDKPLDAKKIKQTPDELLRFIASKDLKQKLKKKSK